MSRSRVIWFCSLVLFVASLDCSAQSNNHLGNGPSPASDSSAVVSIHELQIPQKARAACDDGTKLFAAKKSAESIPEFQRAIKAFPGYYEAYAKLGAAEVDLERWADAESAFRKSLELSRGSYAPAHFGLGLILATVTKQFDEAEAVVRGGLDLAPTDVSGHFILAWVLYSTDRLQEAEKSAGEAIASSPTFGGALLLLAQIHLQEQKFPSVVKDADAYLALGVAGPMADKVRAVRARALHELPNPASSSEVAKAER